jgi:hypothetical protein
VANGEMWVELNLNPAICETIAGTGAQFSDWVVVSGWVR